MAVKNVAALAGAAVVALLALASPVAAHVSIYPDPTPASSTTQVEFRVPHGCDGASTNRVVAQIPSEFRIDSAAAPEGWDVEWTTSLLGGEITWSTVAAVLPDETVGVFTATLTAPDTPGAYTLPVRQQCVNGAEIVWDGVDETAAVLNVGPAGTAAGEAPALGDTPLHLDDGHDHGDMGGTDSTVHDHGDMGHSHDEPVAATAPMSIGVDVTADAVGGYNLVITTDGFRWSPEGASGPHVDGDGHAHLYVNGAKTRIYGPYQHLALDPGVNEIEVTLNANDHRPYTWDGVPLRANAIVEVPGDPAPASDDNTSPVETPDADEDSSAVVVIAALAAATVVFIAAAAAWVLIKKPTRQPSTSPADTSAEPHE